MLLAQLPVTVVMQRRALANRWCQEAWRAVAVLPGAVAPDPAAVPDPDLHFTHGLQLELHSDERDGYFENWVAPEPKVFVLWQMQQGRGVPMQVSVSYGEGARMLDSGDHADGVPMPGPVHDWLGLCLRCHPPPRERGPRRH